MRRVSSFFFQTVFICVGELAIQFENENKGSRHKFISNNGRYIYHIAIIDYLQGYDLEKKAENFYKVVLKQRKEYKISCVPPQLYKRRFRKFMRENVIIN